MYTERIKEKKFPWGGRVFAARYPAYGSVSIVGSVVGGSRLSGSDEISKIHAEMLLEGTRRRGKKEIQILLDDMGASLSFGHTSDRLCFSARARAAHLARLLALVAEILREPSFPRAELAVLKQREEANLSMEEQDPNTQTTIGITGLLFSKKHPNRKETTKEARAALKKVTSKSLQQCHAKMLSKKSFVLAVAGDVAPQKVFALAQKEFATLPDKTVTLPKFAKALPIKPRRIVTPVLEKASITYSAGIVLGITKNHPDYPALMLGLQILGSAGGFVGRLMRTVREQEGLTYGTYSYIPDSSISNTTDGYIEVWATFAPQLFVQGRAAVLREVKKIVEKGVTEEEVRKHRELFAARSKVQLSSSKAFAGAAHGIGVEGRKVSYLEEFPRRVLKLTAKEVNRALKKYLVLSKLSESAAGPIAKNALTS